MRQAERGWSHLPPDQPWALRRCRTHQRRRPTKGTA